MDFIITNDPGGYVVEYVIRARKINQSGRRIKIAGRCDSACTLYLTVPNVCITPKARLGFHKATKSRATQYMLQVYPRWVRNWIADQGGLKTRIVYMSYTYASKHLETC